MGNYLNLENLKKNSVILCWIHNGEIVTPGFNRSALEFQFVDRQNRWILHSLTDAQGPFHEHNRNRCVKTALEVNPDGYSMWIDTDILFDPDQVYSLVTQADPIERPIICGLYFGFPGEITRIQPLWYEDYGDGHNLQIVKSLYGDPLQPIQASGMGFTLIHNSVFAAMPERIVTCNGVEGKDPWRWFGRDLYVRPDGTLDRRGEDMSFFARIWEMPWHGRVGVPVYGHRGVTVKHRKSRDLGVEEYLDSLTIEKLRETAVAPGIGKTEGPSGMGAGIGGAATILDANGRVVKPNDFRH